jgi:Terminase small subunit
VLQWPSQVGRPGVEGSGPMVVPGPLLFFLWIRSHVDPRPFHFAFVQNYIANGGNATAAVKASGYKGKYPDKEASRLMRTKAVRDLLASHTAKSTEQLDSLTSIDSVLRRLLAIMDGDAAAIRDRLVAIQTLGRFKGYDAPRKVEVSGPAGGPITLTSVRELSDQELEAEIRKMAEVGVLPAVAPPQEAPAVDYDSEEEPST